MVERIMLQDIITNFQRQFPKTSIRGWKHQKSKHNKAHTPRIQETSHYVIASAHLFHDLFDIMYLKTKYV